MLELNRAPVTGRSPFSSARRRASARVNQVSGASVLIPRSSPNLRQAAPRLGAYPSWMSIWGTIRTLPAWETDAQPLVLLPAAIDLARTWPGCVRLTVDDSRDEADVMLDREQARELAAALLKWVADDEAQARAEQG